MIGRIPCKNPYSYVEIDGTEVEENLKSLIDVVNKYSATHEEPKKANTGRITEPQKKKILFEVKEKALSTVEAKALLKKETNKDSLDSLNIQEASKFIEALMSIEGDDKLL